jgi:eukaryotic-like serine/threonine-protein kinase
MSLTSGKRLGHYQVVSPLGAGGMGEVYQALDTVLDRQVALKILPDSLATDPERLSRFSREAQILASLNHPHIAQVYGLETFGNVRVIVMELVEGKDLADRIRRGALPLDEALVTAKQITDALASAHERGIVHRDLKPSNIKVRPDGTLKVLDFGLAKAMEQQSVDLGKSPTITSPAMTGHGVILGTAAYMSPEQAKGQPVDKRSDIWAFGCVLFETLTGRLAFGAETVSETLAKVIEREPDWTALPAATPAGIRRLLRRCLAKQLRQRLADIADARLEIEQALDPIADLSSATVHRGATSLALWRALPWALATLLSIALAVLGGGRPARVATSTLALTVVPPSSIRLDPVGGIGSAPEISPNADTVMYAAVGGLYLRRLDSLDSTRVPGSERATGPGFWAADSKAVVFPASDQWLKVGLPDGAPQVIARLEGVSRGASWSDSGLLLVSVGQVLYAIATASGDGKPIETPGMKAGGYLYPEFLPGSEDFLFLFLPSDGGDGEVHLATLRDGTLVDSVLLTKSETAARYTPLDDGRILYVRGDSLYAHRLDRKSRRLTGEAELVATNVASGPGRGVNRADFSVSGTGAVAWRPGKAALSQVTIFDRQGKQLATAGPPSSVDRIAVSPDETRLVASGGEHAWIMDVGQPGRIPLPTGIRWFDWHADGSRVVGLGSLRQGTQLVELSADGSGPVRQIAQFTSPLGNPQDFSPDGRHVLARHVGAGPGGQIVSVRTEGTDAERTPVVTVSSELFAGHPSFAQTGDWIAYQEWHTGGVRPHLYVQPFPGNGLRRQVGPNGNFPQWTRSDQEIVYFRASAPAGLWRVPVQRINNQMRFGEATELFAGLRLPAGSNLSSRPLAVSRDGNRIFFVQAVEQPETDVIHVKLETISK